VSTTFDLKPNGNSIVKPITPDRLKDGSPACGFDGYNQLWVRVQDGDDGWRGHIVADVRAHVCPICKRGWENTAASIGDQQFIHGMDRHAHETCMNGFAYLKTYYFWHNIVCDSDINLEGLTMDETKNQYGSTWAGAWYHVVFKHIPGYRFTVGRRKRVDNIEVNGVDEKLAEMLKFSFESEGIDITRGYDAAEGRYYIHAWTDEKAKRYLAIMVHLIQAYEHEKKTGLPLSKKPDTPPATS
jgi:hypothetical protein